LSTDRSRSKGRGNAKSARRRQRRSPPQTPGIAARHRTARGTERKGGKKEEIKSKKLMEENLDDLRGRGEEEK
jgi:hypothetical protein